MFVFVLEQKLIVEKKELFMPTILTHAVIGYSGSKIIVSQDLPKRFFVLSAILPVLPDADSIGFMLGIPYWHILGHRGFFHSILFAFLLAVIVMFLFFRNEKIFSKKWNLKLLFFFLITSSHGILDAFTNGGLGIALLSPFDNTRFFFPYTPIPVSPISVGAFLSGWGAAVLFAEIVCIWVPLIIIVYLAKSIKMKFKFK